MASKTLRICKQGHRYYKSSDCPTCPFCEKELQPEQRFLSLLSAPARRALQNLGVETAEQLSEYTEREILRLHGMGKASLPTLRNVLTQNGLSFKE